MRCIVQNVIVCNLALMSCHLHAATLDPRIRHSQHGASVVALVPLYRWYLHKNPGETVGSRHGMNSKRVVWSAYERILSELYDAFDDKENFLDGFRFMGFKDVQFSNGRKLFGAPVYTCFFVFLGDMDEVWSVLGISGCVACCCPDHQLDEVELESPRRTFDEALATIFRVRQLKRQRGNAELAKKTLSAQRLHPFHLQQPNPFFHLPHVDVECFPMDWLHGMYVAL